MYVAQFVDYTTVLIDHLAHVKISHWDRSGNMFTYYINFVKLTVYLKIRVIWKYVKICILINA